MNKLRKLIAALSHSLGIQTALHQRAIRRMHARHADQKAYEKAQAKAEAEAKRLRKEAHEALTFGPNENQARGTRLLRKANRKDENALRYEAKATAQRNKAIVWKGRIRVLAQRIHKIDVSLAAAQKELRELGPTIDFEKQKTTGGTFPERWLASNVASWQRYQEGIRAGRYSQEGPPQIHDPYGPGPRSGRDDCSTYGTSQALATGADDPNGNDFSGEGFTGTLAEAHGRWKEVSLATMIKARQGYIIYGSGSGHHTEMYAPSKTDPMRTIGHGSSPVDPGTVHLFGSGETERYYIYDPN